MFLLLFQINKKHVITVQANTAAVISTVQQQTLKEEGIVEESSSSLLQLHTFYNTKPLSIIGRLYDDTKMT
jgi:hypothetical protein